PAGEHPRIDRVLLQESAEVAAILRRRARGVRDVAAVLAKNPREVLALERLDRLALEYLERSTGPVCRRHPALRSAGQAEVLDVDDIRPAHAHRPDDGVLQLANVARPVEDPEGRAG